MRIVKRWKAAVPLALALVPAMVSIAAAEGEHAAPRWGDFGWRVLNLVIFAGIIWYFVGNMAKKFFRERRENIQSSLNDLEARRSRAKDNLAEVERRIANIDGECRSMLEESRAQAENLKKGIIEDAHRQAEQIVAQAKLAAENEGRAVMAQIRATLADEIVDAAEKALQKKLDAAAHEKLIFNSLNKVVLQ